VISERIKCLKMALCFSCGRCFVSFLAEDLQTVKMFVLSSFPACDSRNMATGRLNTDIANLGKAVTMETKCPCAFISNNFNMGLEIF
jgi:hypothetical protein